ncbi:at-rich interactive domain-containing 2 [Olea europaea subsp. europaea]|uniref:At-rich interactive domain-containing 2 n=2 Tax=Olea europaea subsp. europaea TaxID=158383 RepID=A0A8S0R9H6_OLEEU|nr:at-rich interactive domain-containing 2 [Olea europaea subsp. europaea]
MLRLINALNMVQKRPFDEDESNQVSSKQPRQMEHNSQLVSALEFPPEPVVQSCHTSGEGDNGSTKTRADGNEKLDIAYITELQFCSKKDVETSVRGSLPSSSLFPGSISEEDIRPETQFHIILSPDHVIERQPRTIAYPGEIYSLLLDHPPRKLVPVGQYHQADIPEWGSHFCKTPNCSEHTEEAPNLVSQVLETDEERLAGTCVVPMSDSDQLADNGEVGVGRTDCICEDEGSIRCFQQHIMEAREKLEGTFGPETFAELGLCDVGEIVAEKWSEEEEKLFHQVIFSNPTSLGKNYWNHLAVVFPSRSKKEIVGYYFNVFMLRRRAEQNRFAPLNIDSDDDEWVGTEDSTDNEVQNGEDEDSVAESPIVPDRNEILDINTRAYDEEVLQSAPVDARVLDFRGENINVPESSTCKLDVKCSLDPTVQPSHGNLSHNTGRLDAQEGMCTSSDARVGSQVTMEKAGSHKQCPGQLNGANGISGHEFMMEACNAREWEFGYLTCPRNEVELLPTCNMIEEVFGAGSWDGQGLN